MDELEISGKRHISTRRAAREHGYHSDYMGQLIRSKKVAGQKVGRSWYIDEESLNAYLGKAPTPAPPRVVVPVPAEEPALINDAPAVAEPAPASVPVAQHDAVPAPEPVPVRTADEEVPHPAAPSLESGAEIEIPVTRLVQVSGVESASTQANEAKEQPVPAPRHAQEPVRAIYHAPYMEEQEAVRWRETRIPVRAFAPEEPQRGGLRYAADDYVHSDAISANSEALQSSHRPVPAPRKPSSFPYKSLAFVALLATVASVFASNFISTTIVSEQGKSATVIRAIHW